MICVVILAIHGLQMNILRTQCHNHIHWYIMATMYNVHKQFILVQAGNFSPVTDQKIHATDYSCIALYY